jgi:integrase
MENTKMRAKIGIKAIAAMQPNSILWDQEVRGLCARRQFSEIITYSVVFRTQEQTQRWMKLGRHPILTPHLARQRAIQVLRDVILGKDPAAEMKALRSALTVSQLCDEYSAKVSGKKPKTIESDKSRINLHIKPKLGKLKVATITSEDIEAFMHSMSPGSAKRVVGLLGAIMSYAIKRKMRTDNPVHGVEKPRDKTRTRRLSNNEYAQLHKVISGAAPNVASVITMLAVTGWRSGEARFLKWDEINIERRIATLSDTKTGVSIRPLSMAAIEIIEAQPKNSPYVFGKPIGHLWHAWKKLGLAADVSPHTLRHSFASLSADMGLSDSTIAGLLGHSRSSITSRYIHMEKALIEAADTVAQETLRLMRS